MLDLKQIESFHPEPLRVIKKNLLRKYLQYKILDIIFNSELSNKLIFMGGIAIRLVHGSSRFSEILDFDNFNLDKSKFENLTNLIESKLTLDGYTVEIKIFFLKKRFIVTFGFKICFTMQDFLDIRK